MQIAHHEEKKAFRTLKFAVVLRFLARVRGRESVFFGLELLRTSDPNFAQLKKR